MKKLFQSMVSISALLVILTFMVAVDVGDVMALTICPGVDHIDLRFDIPGARANAMGGAFIAVADDATAAYTNPAGLTILTKPELALEYKYTEYKTTQYSQDADHNTVSIDTTNNVQGPSFVSVVYPTGKELLQSFDKNL